MTEIWRIDDNGNLAQVAVYSIDAKNALIAYKRQEQSDYNTWDYPAEDPEIRQTRRGEYVYFSGVNTSTFTQSV